MCRSAIAAASFAFRETGLPLAESLFRKLLELALIEPHVAARRADIQFDFNVQARKPCSVHPLLAERTSCPGRCVRRLGVFPDESGSWPPNRDCEVRDGDRATAALRTDEYKPAGKLRPRQPDAALGATRFVFATRGAGIFHDRASTTAGIKKPLSDAHPLLIDWSASYYSIRNLNRVLVKKWRS